MCVSYKWWPCPAYNCMICSCLRCFSLRWTEDTDAGCIMFIEITTEYFYFVSKRWVKFFKGGSCIQLGHLRSIEYWNPTTTRMHCAKRDQQTLKPMGDMLQAGAPFVTGNKTVNKNMLLRRRGWKMDGSMNRTVAHMWSALPYFTVWPVFFFNLHHFGGYFPFMIFHIAAKKCAKICFWRHFRGSRNRIMVFIFRQLDPSLVIPWFDTRDSPVSRSDCTLRVCACMHRTSRMTICIWYHSAKERCRLWQNGKTKITMIQGGLKFGKGPVYLSIDFCPSLHSLFQVSVFSREKK